MKRSALCITLIYMFFIGQAQNLEKASKYFIEGQYEEAIEEFKSALPSIENQYGTEDTNYYSVVLFYIAASYDRLNQFPDAEFFYLKAKLVYEKNNTYSNKFLLVINDNLAKLFYKTGQFEKAQPLYLIKLINTEKSLGKNHPDYRVILNRLAECYFRIGQYDNALPLYLENLKNVENSLGKEHLDYVRSLNNLALLYGDIGEYEKALPLFLQVLTITEKTLGKDHPDFGACLNNLAELYKKMGLFDKALPLYLKALKNTEESLGKNHSEYGISLNNLALLYAIIGQYEEALPLYLQAISITEKSLGKDHPFYGTFLNNLATLYETMGKYELALPLYLQVLNIAEKSIGTANPNYGLYLNNLALLYQKLGMFNNALLLYLEALNIVEKSLGKNHNDYGKYLNNLALLYDNFGQDEKALPLYLQSLNIAEKTLGKDHPDYGTYLNNLALLYQKMGNFDKALPLYLQALKNAEKSVSKNHSVYGKYLNNLALLYDNFGQDEKALPLYLQSLNIAEKTLGKDHPDYGTYLNNLALLYQKMGNFDKALPLYLQALKNAEKSVGKNHSDYGISLNNLALLYVVMGQYEKAQPLYLLSISVIEKSLGENNPFYGVVLSNLGLLFENIGQFEKSIPLYKVSLNVLSKNIDKNFNFLSEKGKTEFTNSINYNFEYFKSFCIKNNSIELSLNADAFNIELATKGMILITGIEMRNNIKKGVDSTTIRIFEEWKILRAILAKQYSFPLSKRRDDLAEIEEQANKLEVKLTKISSTFKESKLLLARKWTDIQNTLKPKEVAIEFSSFNYHNGKKWTDSIMYVALVLRKGDKYPSMIPLCEARQLDSLLKKENSSDASFISQLYRGAEIVNKNKSFSYGKRLYDLVWKPLDNLLNRGDKVYFAPSGLLHQIAFAAIPYSKDTLLSDRYNLNQLSSTSMLLKESLFKETKPESITVFGGINYDAKEKEILEAVTKDSTEKEFVSRSLPSDLTRSETWTYLPGTLKESEAITTIAKANKIKVNSYYGLSALEENYKKIGFGKSPQVLHISTHGFFFPDPKTEKRKDFNFGDEGKTVFKYSDDPLNRAGLLFTGANNTWAGKPISNVEDGILTAYEAANVSLSNTQLVVLSACETGLGDIKGSEGVFGLQRAFKMAGTEYVMMSLWKVPDIETSEFMTYFYTTWFKGKSIPDAFIATQNYMKIKYPNEPYKWAAFVLVK